jgi:hypothetical protein
MIYDLGCLHQPDLFKSIVFALPGVLAVLAVAYGLTALGAAINRSHNFIAYDLFSGWGIVAAIMTLAAVYAPTFLVPTTTIILIAMLVTVLITFRKKLFIDPFWLLAIIPGVFLMIAINIAGVAKWDDFSHWVPNALYLYKHNGVPSMQLPPTASAWPGYPYGLPFITYMASWLAGGFLVQGGAMFSFLLLLAFASFLVAIISKRRTLATTALALVVVTLANPGFNASFSISNQGDTPTMVLIGTLAILFWKIVNGENARQFFLPIALTATALVLIKQSNLAILGLLTISFMVVAIKNKMFRRCCFTVLPALIPAFTMRLVWQHHVDGNMIAAFVMRPFSEWRFDLVLPILHSILQAMIKANGLSIMMLGISAYAVPSFFRPPTPLRNFAVMVGVTYIGYLVFLLTVYIGASFGEVEAKRATSFYRYCTHTSLLGIAFLWMAGSTAWAWLKNKNLTPKAWPHAAHIFSTCFLIGLLPLVFALHAKWVVPQPGEAVCAVRNLGGRIAHALPPHSRVGFIDPQGNGLDPFIINLELGLDNLTSDKQNRIVDTADALEPGNLSRIFKRIDDKDIDTVILKNPEDTIRKRFDFLQPCDMCVLRRDSNHWSVVPLADVP